MRNQSKLLIPAALVVICAVPSAPCSELIANFDSFTEGPIGPSFTDGGIAFSDLDVALPGGPFNFIAEDASAATWSQLSHPNYLTGTGYANGPGYGFGRFRALTITFPGMAKMAGLDIFTPRSIDHNFLTLAAFSKDAVITSAGLWLDQGIELDAAASYHALSISAPSFDKLTLLVTDQTGSPAYSFLGVDNVRVVLVPEPSVFLLSAAVVVFSLHRRKSVPHNRV
jgi:hypothetical protein